MMNGSTNASSQIQQPYSIIDALVDTRQDKKDNNIHQHQSSRHHNHNHNHNHYHHHHHHHHHHQSHGHSNNNNNNNNNNNSSNNNNNNNTTNNHRNDAERMRKKFRDAIYVGNFERVARIIKNIIENDTLDLSSVLLPYASRHVTPIGLAARRGHVKICKVLVEVIK
eukprot:37300_1